jgi:general nucleoside transport system ATP-binding protein
MPIDASPPLLQARGIVKRFPAVLANDHVDFDMAAGEVHALLGENGAGKSTLSKILYGYYRADEGEILVQGRPVAIGSPRDARQAGIGMVFQSFTLIPALTVLENAALFLPDLPPVLSMGALRARVGELATRFRISVDLDAPVGELSVGDRQKVEILKLLLAGARILIFDEPTRVLAPQEVEELYGAFAELTSQGYAVLFITHKLHEVMRCADRITVMGQGRVRGTLARADATEASLVSLMFGRSPVPEAVRVGAAARRGEGPPLLELRAVRTRPAGRETALQGLDLTVRGGEILGVAGVSGNGQRELGDLILGLKAPLRGKKLIDGRDASAWPVRRVRESGVGFVPEDASGMASFAGLTVRENLALGGVRRYRKGLSLDWGRLESEMRRSFEGMGMEMPPLDSRIGALSGGNLQKAAVARELAQEPRLVVAMYPTRGLDVRSSASLRVRLDELRRSGAGVLLVSEDLDELFGLCDRLVVLYEGAVAGELGPAEFRPERVGPLMTGGGLR